jgi:hypothetical protein
MSWFKSKEEQLRDNLYDEQVHAQVAGEIAANQIWPGLQVKAFAEAQGNEVKAKAIYIMLRVAQIKLGVDANPLGCIAVFVTGTGMDAQCQR